MPGVTTQGGECADLLRRHSSVRRLPAAGVRCCHARLRAPRRGRGSLSHGSPSLHVSPPMSHRVPRSAAPSEVADNLRRSSLIRLSSNLKWRKLKPCDEDRQAIATRSPNGLPSSVGTLEGSHRFAIGGLGDEGCPDRCQRADQWRANRRRRQPSALSRLSATRKPAASARKSRGERRDGWLRFPRAAGAQHFAAQCSQGLHQGARKI
jgi:hypothetical protein